MLFFQLLLAVFLTIDTKADSTASYSNHQLWRLHATNEKQITRILAFSRIAHLHDINFWTDYFRINMPVSFVV